MQLFCFTCKIFIFILLGCSVTQAAQYNNRNGIILESNRVIYLEKDKNGISFTVKNQTSFTYLLQSRIVPWQDKIPYVNNDESIDNRINSSTEQNLVQKKAIEKPVPFIVIPPLVRFEPNDDITLKIKLINNDLPQDRESIFTLSLKAIPSQTVQDNSTEGKPSSMFLALQNNLKFFYRPESIIHMDDDEKSMALQFSLQNNQLIITNPTPYYITLNNIELDRKPFNLGHKRMIAPLSVQTFNHVDTHAKIVNWQIIGDNGSAGPEKSKTLR